jgi:hypothetical protein
MSAVAVVISQEVDWGDPKSEAGLTIGGDNSYTAKILSHTQGGPERQKSDVEDTITSLLNQAKKNCSDKYADKPAQP